MHHYNESIPVWYNVAGMLGISAMIYHDYESTKVLWRYRTQKYELADFQDTKSTEMAHFHDLQSEPTNLQR